MASSDREDGRRLVKLAERLVARQRTAASLDFLGAALYRAGCFEEAARTLTAAGAANNGLVLALAQQHLGQAAEARDNLGRFEKWTTARKFTTWQEATRWQLLYAEARRLILAMSRAER